MIGDTIKKNMNKRKYEENYSTALMYLASAGLSKSS